MNILATLPGRATRVRPPQEGNDWRIERGRVLVDGEFAETPLTFNAGDGRIGAIGGDGGAGCCLDAAGLLVLPGIVDIHGDAFERQMMPRPGVAFPIDIALLESDRQAVANGITTVFHGVTWSWEPGLRASDNAHAILAGIERLRARLHCDTRYHLRHETYNLDAEAEIIAWIEAGRIDALAFNDHMTSTIAAKNRPHQVAQMAERSGLSIEAFDHLIASVQRRGPGVAASIERLAAVAQRCRVPLLSHDDTSPAQRAEYRALGCRIAEFPTNEETAEAAVAAGDVLVFGAPNVVRGGSHTGWTDATDMVRRGRCAILASDYYYPAPLLAAFRLAAVGAAPLPQAWRLIAEAPATAVGLTDRGTIAVGKRADLVLVDASDANRPHAVATICGGQLFHLTDGARIRTNGI
jgi:alpha-D-ribose 1-methylphosphonate 5-triphosphate diphosphatase